MSVNYPSSLTVQVSLTIRRRPGRKSVVTPEGKASSAVPRPATQTHGDPVLVKALARAFRYQRMLDEGRHSSITEMAEAERLDRGYMGRLLQLTLLAPSIVAAVLDGGGGDRLDLPRMMEPLPVDWMQQGTMLG